METLASANPAGTPLPGFLNSLAGPLDHYGYGAIALLLLLENIGVPVIPGELGMIAGAIFAGTGRAGLNVVVVGVVAVAAAIAGAEIGYLIGRFAGRELILHYGKWVLIRSHHLDRAEAIVSRYGGIVVVIARYIVGLREANGIIAGITQMRWLTFGWFNVLGACAWVATWVSIGYAAGDHIGTIYRDVNRFALYALLALAILLAGYVIRRIARRRRHRAVSVTAEASEAETAPVAEEQFVVKGDSETEEAHGAEEVHGFDEDSGTREGTEVEGHEAGADSGTREGTEVGGHEPGADSGTREGAGVEGDEPGEDSATPESP